MLLLGMLLVSDALLIALHLSQKLVGVPATQTYDLGIDRSYSEVLLMMKWAWIAMLCVVAWRTRRAPVLLAVAAVCAILFVEDGLSLHEAIGRMFAPAAARVVDLPDLALLQVGELAWFAVLAAAIAAISLIGWIRSDPPARRDATALAGFFVAFAFCAVVLDTVHSLTTMGTGLDTALTVLEDGGELVSMSPAVAFAYAIARREPASAPVAPGVA